MNCGIYLIINVMNGKRYIGSTKNIRNRKYNHFYNLKKGEHVNSHLQSSYDSYGRSAFYFMVLELCEPIDDLLLERENWWIDYYDTMNPEKGYNLVRADRTVVSGETREKLSSAAKRRRHSEATKKKMSAAKIGQPKSEEHRAKIGAANSIALKGRPSNKKGKITPDSTREKLSTALKGKPWTEARRAAYIEKTKGI